MPNARLVAQTRIAQTRIAHARIAQTRIAHARIAQTRIAQARLWPRGLRPRRPGLPCPGRPRLIPRPRSRYLGSAAVRSGAARCRVVWTSGRAGSARTTKRPAVSRRNPPGAVGLRRVRETPRSAVGVPRIGRRPGCRTGCGSTGARRRRRAGRRGVPTGQATARAASVAGLIRTSAGCWRRRPESRGGLRCPAGVEIVSRALARPLRGAGLAEVLDPVVIGVASRLGTRPELIPAATRFAAKTAALLTIRLLPAATLPRVEQGAHGEWPARVVGAEHGSVGEAWVGFGGQPPASRTGLPGVVVVGVGPPRTLLILRPSRCHYDLLLPRLKRRLCPMWS
jgi:hypothetical protein